MQLLNKTKHSTQGLRIMLYDLATKANISTKGLKVEVRRATRYLHGVCYPHNRKIILWVLNNSKTQDISFLWLHELTHLTPRNRKLYAGGHGRKAQVQADNTAVKILGIDKSEVTWGNNKWHTRRLPAFHTKKSAQQTLKEYKIKYPAWQWRINKVTNDKEFPYRLQWRVLTP